MRYYSLLVLTAALAACGEKSADQAATGGAATTVAAPAVDRSRDWTQVAEPTPEGGFRMGNPAARVKLVEYASLTCPHCREFHEAAGARLKASYVASGNVSYEFRNFVFNGPDYAASLLTRCQGGPAFFNLTGAFFDAFNDWTAPFAKLDDAATQRLSALPQDQQLLAVARIGGLDAFMRARGMTSAKFEQCLTDPAALKRLAEMRDKATADGVIGTPSFFINGIKQDAPDWAALEPKLQAALL